MKNELLKTGDKITIHGKHNKFICEGEVVSADDDSDQYITNPELWINVRVNGVIYSFRGDNYSMSGRSKTTSKWGSVYFKKI